MPRTEGEQASLARDKFIAIHPGAGRYIYTLIKHLGERIDTDFQGDLVSLIEGFDQGYDRRKEIESLEKKGVKVFGGAVIRAYPELIERRPELIRLAEEQDFFKETEEL